MVSKASERWLILAVLFLARTAIGFQFQAVAALSSSVVADFSIDYTQLGLLIGLYLFPGIVIAYPGGLLGQYFGDKRIAVFGMALMVAGGLLTATGEYSGVLAGRLIGGVGAVLLNVLLIKMTVDWFIGREIGTALAILVSSWPVGVAPVYVVYANHAASELLFFGHASVFGVPMPIFVFAAAALVMHSFLSRTSIGRFIYAQGDNPDAARLTGIALRPQIVLEYVLVAVFAWLAGLVWIGQTGSMQTNMVVVGTQIFDVILVVVLGGISLVGGRGGVFSVVVGCALIGTLLNAFTIMDVNSEVQNIIRGVVLLVAIIVDNWLHPRDEETARQGD